MQQEYERLVGKVRSIHADYNPERRLYRSPFHSPGYHTRIRQADYVHATNNNTIYALALLDTGLPEYEERAFEVLDTIVSLQDTDRESPTFGIWSWFYEEPLSEMAPPDWNWADFIGKNLTLVLVRHGGRLGKPLYDSVCRAVSHAADAIIKRNVGPHYTNIAIMGAFVTLVAGELLGRRDYTGYGLRRLENFREFTQSLGTFQEYNSPTYAAITILELSKLKSETRSERAKAICDEMLDLAWGMVAEHYHAPTSEWGGPHSRSYQTLLRDDVQAFLRIATDGAVTVADSVEYYSPEWYKSGAACPERYLSFFREPAVRTVRNTLMKDERTGFEKRAYTYLSPRFALGSFNREIMWNQCRSLVGYFSNGGKAVYLHLRLLSDGYDFSSGLLHCDQQEGLALFGLNLFTNGGNTHPVLDKTNGSLTTSDLRIRFEFGGAVEGIRMERDGENRIRTGTKDLPVVIQSVFSALELQPPVPGVSLHWEITRQDGKLSADYLLYRGQTRTFEMESMEKAAFVFALTIGEPDGSLNISVEEHPQGLRAQGSIAGRELSVAMHVKPCSV